MFGVIRGGVRISVLVLIFIWCFFFRMCYFGFFFMLRVSFFFVILLFLGRGIRAAVDFRFYFWVV